MRTNSHLTIAGLALFLAARHVSALPDYVSLVPNGDVHSCATCHTTPPTLNPFGSAFLSAGFSWTPALAALDTDGDGFTNGQELGDPQGTGTPIAGAQVTLPGDSTSKPTLFPPDIRLSSPTNGAVFPAPFTGTISATTTNAPATITQIGFYAGTTLLGTVNAPPFSLTATNLAAGMYSLTAKATDYLGAVNTSAPVTITVAAPSIALTLVLQNGTNGVLQWTGGAPPFVVQKKVLLTDPAWLDISTTAEHTVTLPLAGPTGFLRVKN
jgi:hypothetical protein